MSKPKNHHRNLTLADVTVELFCEEEHLPIEGNASYIDPETDAAIAAYIRGGLEAGNDWAWCTAHVRLTYKGLSADDYLGGCSYLSETDFRTPGGYFDDMLHTCLAELNAKLRDLCSCPEEK